MQLTYELTLMLAQVHWNLISVIESNPINAICHLRIMHSFIYIYTICILVLNVLNKHHSFRFDNLPLGILSLHSFWYCSFNRIGEPIKWFKSRTTSHWLTYLRFEFLSKFSNRFSAYTQLYDMHIIWSVYLKKDWCKSMRKNPFIVVSTLTTSFPFS